MPSGKKIWESFIQTKQISHNSSIRKKWHGIHMPNAVGISVNMFLELERYIRGQGWVAYAWAAKSKLKSDKMFRSVTKNAYSKFPVDQQHWDAIYVSCDFEVAMGYMDSDDKILNRIYISQQKIGNIWNTGRLHLGTPRADKMMRHVARYNKTHSLFLFGITGPQSQYDERSETALIGDSLDQFVISIPTRFLNSDIGNMRIAQELVRIVNIHNPIHNYEEFEAFLESIQ